MAIINTELNYPEFIFINAGENIAEKRWTTQRKHELLDSRLKSTNFLLNLTKTHNLSLKAFVTAGSTVTPVVLIVTAGSIATVNVYSSSVSAT